LRAGFLVAVLALAALLFLGPSARRHLPGWLWRRG
jgi:hypothetical protein